MALHDMNPYDGSGPKGFLVALDPTAPSNPVYMGIATNPRGEFFSVQARQNYGSLEFLVMTRDELVAKAGERPDKMADRRALTGLDGARSCIAPHSFSLDAVKRELFWRNPSTNENQVIASRYDESALDFTGYQTIRVVGADRSFGGMIAKMPGLF